MRAVQIIGGSKYEPFVSHNGEKLPFRKDYSRANSSGSKGVVAWYDLQVGNQYLVQYLVRRKKIAIKTVVATESGVVEAINGKA